jgi:hypothetical protein
MNPVLGKVGPRLLLALALAVILFYAQSAFRAYRTPPGGGFLVVPAARTRSLDISRGSYSMAFRDSSPIQVSSSVRFAASPQNVATGTAVYCSATRCSFVLAEVLSSAADRTVKILGEHPGSTSELTYTCFDCSVGLQLAANIPSLVRARGFSGPGVILTLNSNATALSVECQAQTCTTRQERDVTREFRRGKIVTLPTKSKPHFSFSRS